MANLHQMLQTLDGGRLSIAAMGLGGAQGAFEEALKYAKEREQFGKPIGKFQAVARDIKERSEKGQPVLVGTISIEKSELLASRLKKTGVPHVVLNAKYHAQEAEIVAQAGRKDTVTIATNMAGRGTDILLGGNPKSLAEELVRRGEVSQDGLDLAEYEKVLARLAGYCDFSASSDLATALRPSSNYDEAMHALADIGGGEAWATLDKAAAEEFRKGAQRGDSQEKEL